MCRCFGHRSNTEGVLLRFSRGLIANQDGYAIRMSFGEFVRKYQNISFEYGSVVASTAESCQAIADKAGIKDFQLGHTKVIDFYEAD